ncbi:hypothetical protein EYF80_007805 [Liparis tanakae]|uniref:Uncharacterized protein n=1 Tax=Liparis tanakae TaxID=230148 RepID=A0A4Z2IVX2_9TELE|nr:hypothetical protein EYF80_007805 [Liparis tanakae]
MVTENSVTIIWVISERAPWVMIPVMRLTFPKSTCSHSGHRLSWDPGWSRWGLSFDEAGPLAEVIHPLKVFTRPITHTGRFIPSLSFDLATNLSPIFHSFFSDLYPRFTPILRNCPLPNSFYCLQDILRDSSFSFRRPLVSMELYLQMSRVPTSPEAKSLSRETAVAAAGSCVSAAQRQQSSSSSGAALMALISNVPRVKQCPVLRLLVMLSTSAVSMLMPARSSWGKRATRSAQVALLARTQLSDPGPPSPEVLEPRSGCWTNCRSDAEKRKEDYSLRSLRSLWASFSNPASFCTLASRPLPSGGIRLQGPSVRLRGDTITVWVEGSGWVQERVVGVRCAASPCFSTRLLPPGLVFSESTVSGDNGDNDGLGLDVSQMSASRPRRMEPDLNPFPYTPMACRLALPEPFSVKPKLDTRVNERVEK